MSKKKLISLVTGVSNSGPEPEDAVKEGLDKTQAGIPKAHLANFARILEKDSRWRGRLTYNEFSHEVLLDGKLVDDLKVLELSRWCGDVYGAHTGRINCVHQAIELVAHQEAFHPVLDYLCSLSWDGEPRINRFATDYLGAEDTLLNSTFGRKLLLSAVARVGHPGCKVDTMPILVGPQGVGKSTALRCLAVRSEWFCDTPVDIRSKDFFMNFRGVWLYELSELSSLSRANANRIKSILSSAVDRYRPPYGRCTIAVPRQVVFGGTTNQERFLRDDTGERRFWPLRVGTINLDKIVKDRDQLWAEALQAAELGAIWHLTRDEEELHAQMVEGFKVVHPWTTPIADWLRSRHQFFRVSDVLTGALDLDISRRRPVDEQQVVTILRQLGCESKGQKRLKGKLGRWWASPQSRTSRFSSFTKRQKKR